MLEKNLPKLIVILGPTATGKTSLAVELARIFNGEIISADSRQVYIGMDIGTGKDLAEYGKGKNKIHYHMIDVVKPMTEFNVAKFKTGAIASINDIIKRGKTPILVGGTGLWISAVVDNYDIPRVKPNKIFRKKLDSMSLTKKISLLKKLDLNSYKTIDLKNSRRIERALEVCNAGILFSKSQKKNRALYDTLQIGLTFPKSILNKRTDIRVDNRMKQGMIKEVKNLHISGVSWKRLENFGLEYRHISKYLQGETSEEEMIKLLKIAIHQFAKRQMTWFKRDKRIHWIKNKKEAYHLVKKFLS